MKTLLLVLLLLAVPHADAQGRFDHEHAEWSALLAKHVVLIDGGKASRVDYAGVAKDRSALTSYLNALGNVGDQQFKSWSAHERLAFLINAYNAHMVALILTRYPDIQSVWDFGKVFNNPFKRRFFRLFGRDYSLDAVEHETLRAKGSYDEPRIHFAVNCASIGCPMLREEAYVSARLDTQLEDQTRRFLSDRARNRYNATTGALDVSEIFKWYREDFESGYRGIGSREQFFATYAALLTAAPEQQQRIRNRQAEIRHLDYDWRLNDARR